MNRRRRWYSGMDNDEATRAAMADLEGVPGFEGLIQHLGSAMKGLRKQALREARGWLDGVAATPPDSQRQVVRQLLALKVRHPGCDRLFVYPIEADLISPICESWLAEDGTDVEILCAMGLLKRDVGYFEQAWAVDNSCQLACRQIIHARLSEVGHQCHHLAEGLFIGEPSDARGTLAEVAKKLPFLLDPTAREHYEQEASDYATLIDLYVEWRAHKPTPFIAFCETRGVRPELPTIVYYKG